MSNNIKHNLLPADNIVSTCGRSGKLMKILAQYWNDNVLLPLVGNNKDLLLSDSWGVPRTHEMPVLDVNLVQRNNIIKK